MNDSLVVIGVGPDLGLSIARQFGLRGCNVALIARRANVINSYAERLQAEGIKALAVPADSGDPSSLRAALDKARSQHGPATVLVYNAVSHPNARPTDIEVDALMSSLQINVCGALVAARYVAGPMREAGRGTILFTGSGVTIEGWSLPLATTMTVGKAALRSLTFALADELGPQGIHVVTINILGSIRRGGIYDPDVIANIYWNLHTQPPVAWRREFVFHEGSTMTEAELTARAQAHEERS